jgi:DNA-binding protein YbaB
MPVAREIDEMFIEEAIERYWRIDERLADFAEATASMEVTVHSPDGLVSVLVSGDGEIRDVDIDERLLEESGADVSRSVRLAVTAAADAVRWAREKLRAETFADYDPVGRP